VVSVERNLFGGIPSELPNERIDELAASPGLRIERIVSTGHASPPGFWYDQPWIEWVIVLSGSAGLLIEGEAQPRELRVGDYLALAPHQRHRVEWTDAHRPTVWLAVHYGPGLP
jgi:cupin 2 domain-containing protein